MGRTLLDAFHEVCTNYEMKADKPRFIRIMCNAGFTEDAAKALTNFVWKIAGNKPDTERCCESYFKDIFGDVEPESAKVLERLVKFAFAQADDDNSGYVSTRELKRILSDVGFDIDSARAIEMFNHFDNDENGQIDEKEFHEFFCELVEALSE